MDFGLGRIGCGCVGFVSLLTWTATIGGVRQRLRRGFRRSGRGERREVEFGGGASFDAVEVPGVFAQFVTLGIKIKIKVRNELFLAEVEGAFGEGEAFFVHALAVFMYSRGVRFAPEVHLHFVLAVLGAGREVGETLKGEEIGWGIVAGSSEVIGCIQNDRVDFFGNFVVRL